MGLAAQANSNSDLVWGLDDISQQQRAIDFISRFENRLCVFSGSVRQLYTNYSMQFPRSSNGNMVILPDPFAFHDTFSHVPDDAIVATGLHIIPGNLIGKQGLYLVVSHKDKKVRSMPIPFRSGLKQILQRCTATDPFLPVLVKGDLREFDTNLPCLHLHRIQLSKLENLSGLERSSIKKVVTEKIMGIYNSPE